jgi:hypothetical protein
MGGIIKSRRSTNFSDGVVEGLVVYGDLPSGGFGARINGGLVQQACSSQEASGRPPE